MPYITKDYSLLIIPVNLQMLISNIYLVFLIYTMKETGKFFWQERSLAVHKDSFDSFNVEIDKIVKI